MTLGVRKQCLALKVSDETRCSINALFDETSQEHLLVCQVHNSEKFLNQLKDHKITHNTNEEDLQTAYEKIRNNVKPDAVDSKPVETKMSTKDFLEILKAAAPAFLLIATFYHFFLYLGRFNYFEIANFSDFSSDIFSPWLLSSLGILFGLIFLHDKSMETEKKFDENRINRMEEKKDNASTRKRAKLLKKIETLKEKDYAPAVLSNLDKLIVASKVLFAAILITSPILMLNRLAIDRGKPKIVRFSNQEQIGGEFDLIKIMDKYIILEKNGLTHIFPHQMIKSISYRSNSAPRSLMSTYIILDNSLPNANTLTEVNSSKFETFIDLKGNNIYQGESFLLLPFFTGEVEPKYGLSNEESENKALIERKLNVFKFGRDENFSDVTITHKENSKEIKSDYFVQLKKSLIICAINAAKEDKPFEIDVLGFASTDPFANKAGNRSINSDELNHILAESRRAAIISRLGFDENGPVLSDSNYKITLKKGKYDESSPIFIELHEKQEFEQHLKKFGFKYSSFEDMQDNLKGKIHVGIKAKKESPALTQAFARSAAIVIEKDSMKYCTH